MFLIETICIYTYILVYVKKNKSCSLILTKFHAKCILRRTIIGSQRSNHSSSINGINIIVFRLYS